MKPIITHFTDDDLYKFTMCCAVIENFPRARVKYTFIDRNDLVYPEGFADRLNEQIAMLEQLVITDREIDFMKRKCSYIRVVLPLPEGFPLPPRMGERASGP